MSTLPPAPKACINLLEYADSASTGPVISNNLAYVMYLELARFIAARGSL
jgi:hypothetical protein